jgi:Plasmid pRiA4b ORF-3-like protein
MLSMLTIHLNQSCGGGATDLRIRKVCGHNEPGSARSGKIASMELSGPVPPSVPAYDLPVSIRRTEPEIWRRLLVPETITVPELHRVLQEAFGWENRHLYGIRCLDRLGQPRVLIGPDDAAEEMGDEPASGAVLFELLDAQQTGPWTLECLQLTVPERTFRDVPALTSGGRQFLLQVQSLVEGP